MITGTRNGKEDQMKRTFRGPIALVACLLAMAYALRADGASTAGQAASQISAADAAPFVGEWTLELQGPDGPGTFMLSITVDKDKVTAEIASDKLAKQPISTISLVNKSLTLGYSFLYEGNPVDAVVSLTPDKDGKMGAQIDFAGGAYVMSGPATKKEKDK
jgi:hypothetical protein